MNIGGYCVINGGYLVAQENRTMVAHYATPIMYNDWHA